MRAICGAPVVVGFANMPIRCNQRMTVEECLDSVDECGAPVVSVCGGEPLIYRELRELLEGILRRKKPHLSLHERGSAGGKRRPNCRAIRGCTSTSISTAWRLHTTPRCKKKESSLEGGQRNRGGESAGLSRLFEYDDLQGKPTCQRDRRAVRTISASWTWTGSCFRRRSGTLPSKRKKAEPTICF